MTSAETPSPAPQDLPPATEADYWLGFDLGGTKMQASIFDKDLQICASKRRRTQGGRGIRDGVDRIVRTMENVLADANLTPQDLRGIGIGCPGPLDLDRGIVLEAPNLGWEQMPLAESVQKALGCPVVVLNDVDAGVYGEYCRGSAQSSRCTLGVFPGTGIGGGCVYEGQILRGALSSCMEIGHIQVLPNGPLCGCGQSGCLEALASRLAISAAAAQAAYRGQAPTLRRLAGTKLSNIRSGVLAKAIRGGDQVIEDIVREAAAHLGQAVAMLVNLINPDTILLGGGLVEAMPELYLATVSHSARALVLPSYRDSFQVVSAELGDDATATGAAAWAQQTLSPKVSDRGAS